MLREEGREIQALREEIAVNREEKDKHVAALREEKWREIQALIEEIAVNREEKDKQVAALREEMGREIQALKKEKGRETQVLRKEGREIQALREKIAVNKEEKDKRVAALREEKWREIQALREEIAVNREEKDKQVAALREEMGREIQALKKEKGRETQVLREESREIQALREVKRKQVGETREEVARMSLQLQLVSHHMPYRSSPPLCFTVHNFNRLKADRKTWTSPDLYTHEQGYKISVKVYPDHGSGVSVYVWAKPGEHDARLKWPARASFTIQLLNQHRDHAHLTRESRVMQWEKPTGDKCTTAWRPLHHPR